MLQNRQDEDQPAANWTGNNAQPGIGNLTQEKLKESNTIQVPEFSLPKEGIQKAIPLQTNKGTGRIRRETLEFMVL